MVKVPRYIGPITRWSYNFWNVPRFLRLFIKILLSSFYVIIQVGLIEKRRYVECDEMNSGYGGKQQDMNPTNINHAVGCLGPHSSYLSKGQEAYDIPREWECKILD